MKDLMEAARLTPSCFNNQPWRFLFLESAEALAKGAEVLSEGNRVWAERAPLLIIGYSKAEDDCQIKGGREYHQFDLGMAVMNLMLAATHHGLAARPMAGFSPKKAKEFFGLDEEDQPLVMIAVGHPAKDESHLPEHYVGKTKKPRERKSVEEIIRKL
jgi:nitroreductase